MIRKIQKVVDKAVEEEGITWHSRFLQYFHIAIEQHNILLANTKEEFDRFTKFMKNVYEVIDDVAKLEKYIYDYWEYVENKRDIKNKNFSVMVSEMNIHLAEKFSDFIYNMTWILKPEFEDLIAKVVYIQSNTIKISKKILHL